MRYLLIFLLFTISRLNIQAQNNTIHKSGNAASNGFSEEKLKRIDNLMQQAVDKNWIKGAVGFIAHNGTIVYNKAFGIDDVNKNTPMKTDLIFRIASQTKAITSVAAMMLFEEGKFLLDDPISKYIPSFKNPRVLDRFNPKDTTYTTKPAKREITFRDLLTHTSGIDYPQIGSKKMRAIYAKADITVAFSDKKRSQVDDINKLGTLPLVAQPGEKFIYSASTDVLGRLVEIISGMSLDNFFHAKIFKPLGMNDTYFYLPQAKQSRLVKVYTEDPKTHEPVLWQQNTMPGATVDYPINKDDYYSGGGGLVSTIQDYAVFLQMLLNSGEYNGHRLLATHTVEIMTKNQIGDIRVTFDNQKFGLGFAITTKKGRLKREQSAGTFWWGGIFGTMYWCDPKEKIVAQLYTQQLPSSHAKKFAAKYKTLVYQALN